MYSKKLYTLIMSIFILFSSGINIKAEKNDNETNDEEIIEINDNKDNEENNEDSEEIEQINTEENEDNNEIIGEDEIYIDFSDSTFQTGGLLGIEDYSYKVLGIETENVIENYEEFESYVISELFNLTSEIDMKRFGYTQEQVNQTMTLIFNRNPLLFFVKPYGFIKKDRTTGLVESYKVRYNEEYTLGNVKEVEIAADEIINGINQNWNDEQKIIYLHDKIVTTIDYDLTYSKTNIYSALVEHSAVCYGYSQALVYLCHRIGIPCVIVSSISMGHAWNLVELNGEGYYIDCTWDDPIGNSSHLFKENCRHVNLLCSQNKMISNGHTGNDWISSDVNNVYGLYTNTYYDKSYYKESNAPIAFKDKMALFMLNENGGAVRIYDYSTGEIQTIGNIEDNIWHPYNRPDTNYKDKYWGVASNSEDFFISGPTTIYKVDRNNKISKIYTLTNYEKTLGYIYGIRADDFNIYYDIYQENRDKPLAKTGTVILAEAIKPVTVLNIIEDSFEIEVNENINAEIEINGDYSDDRLIWTSDKPSIATVDRDGTIRAVSPGETFVRVFYEELEDFCKVVVNEKPVYAELTENEEFYIYNGVAKKPNIDVYDGGKKLILGTDYTVTYKNNTNAGKATAVVTMKGNYSGTQNIEFTVKPFSIESNEIVITNSILIATGKVLSPNIKVSLGNKILTKDKDYKLINIDGKTLRDNGEYQYKIQGIGNYSEERNIIVKVVDKNDGQNSGTKQIALSSAKITVNNVMYNGTSRKLSDANPVIKVNKKELELNKDYIILNSTYSNNINVGTASVIVQGIGGYSGSKKVSFKIVPDTVSIKSSDVIIEDAVYSKSKAVPKITIKDLKEKTDYTVTLKNNNKIGTATATVKFTGNYKGTPAVTKTFEVKKENIKNTVGYVDDIKYSNKKGNFKAKIILTDINGKSLTAGKDYDSNIHYYKCGNGKNIISELNVKNDIANAGDIICAEITGIGNYENNKKLYYKITGSDTSISKAKVKISEQVYTGKEVKLNSKDITITINGKKLIMGEDYEIVGYQNNINKGTAKVIIRGIGSYSNIKNCTFKIGVKNMILNLLGL